MTGGSGFGRDVEAETDRRAFIGRGRSIAQRRSLRPRRPAGRTPRLRARPGRCDPTRRVRVPAKKKVSLTFWTVVGPDREEVETAIARLDHSRELLAPGDAVLDRAPRSRRVISGSRSPRPRTSRSSRAICSIPIRRSGSPRSRSRPASAASRRFGRWRSPATFRSSCLGSATLPI